MNLHVCPLALGLRSLREATQLRLLGWSPKNAGFSLVLGVLLYCSAVAQSQQVSPPDTVRRAQVSILPVPILYYTPDTGVAGGGAFLGVHRAATADASARPSSLVLDLIYTQKKQIMAEIVPDIFLDEGAYRIMGLAHYSKYPMKFCGIGSNTPDALEEPLTCTTTRFSLDVLSRIVDSFSGGISAFYEKRSLSELQSGGLLEAGAIAGSSGGTTVGAGLVFQWDTRDNIFWPSEGRYYQAAIRTSTPWLGSDFNFTAVTLDFREFRSITEQTVLGVQVVAMSTAGTAPFYLLPQLGGGSLMRGYYEGRYRDNALLAGQVEYRFPIFWRFGGVAFAGLGDVASDVSRFSVDAIKPCLGAGLRFLFDPVEKMNVRIDAGFGKGTSGFYVTAKEAF